MGKYNDDYSDKGWSGYWGVGGNQVFSPFYTRENPDKFDWLKLPEETIPFTSSKGRLWPHLNGQPLIYILLP